MPTNVRMVKETPRITGREVMVAFVTEGPTDSVTCQLGEYSVVEDCKSCRVHYRTIPNFKPAHGQQLCIIIVCMGVLVLGANLTC